jgi:hypothetical protein
VIVDGDKISVNFFFGESKMLGKLLLTAAFILIITAGAFAQSETSYQKKYEEWKKSQGDKSLHGSLFVAIEARRMSTGSAVVHFAVGKHTDDFHISVRLVKTEKDANGKSVVTEIPHPNESIIDGNSDQNEFAERSYIKKKGASEANAFEILITAAGKESAKIILEISDKRSYGTFSSID